MIPPEVHNLIEQSGEKTITASSAEATVSPEECGHVQGCTSEVYHNRLYLEAGQVVLPATSLNKCKGDDTGK